MFHICQKDSLGLVLFMTCYQGISDLFSKYHLFSLPPIFKNIQNDRDKKLRMLFIFTQIRGF